MTRDPELPQTDTKKAVCKDPVSLPKYARVNLLKVSVSETISLLESEGYSLVSSEEFMEHFYQCSQFRQPGSAHFPHRLFCQDTFFEYVLVFCPCSPVTSTRVYIESQIILQDKASCLPAHLLAPPSGAVVIDTCAAPGNKTTHLASILNNTGTIYAFDKDEQRYRTLIGMVEKAGAKCVKTYCQDFLKVTPINFPEVEYILVDPSCSGSGIVSRVDYDSRVSKCRLKRLSQFQKHILNHALSFPNVKKVVYSTCSVHFMENEGVVQHVLSCFKNKFHLVNVLPSWNRRGDSKSFPEGNHCIRLSREDLTNGFFVAVFERHVLKTRDSHKQRKAQPQSNPLRKCKSKRRKKSKHTAVTAYDK